MDSDAVHAADFWITAQRPLEIAKIHGNWKNVIKNPWPMFILLLKRTQGVVPRPRPVRVLLSLCGSDLRSVIWWRGVSPEILATIELLSLSLLGGTVTSLWKPRSSETCMAWLVTKNQPIKHKRTLKKPFQRRKRPYPDMKGRPYSFLLMKYFNTLFDKTYHGGLILEVNGLKGNHNLDFPMSLSHPNHSYK